MSSHSLVPAAACSLPLPLFAMAAISPHLPATLPFLPTLWPRPRRLPPNAFAASVVPHRTARVALHCCRHSTPLARNFHGLENAISLWTQHKKQALFASERDSSSNATKQSNSSDDASSSSDGPPVLTILAGVIVFLLVFWAIGSIITWIVGLAFGAAKS
ncbi:uncharacterized protein LOC133917007 [Phragmites australis]|uniref:uncharacterized protein LOC133917007 n=1 Tax=Phragmites australis TaxID=29695 RepID=UPI002D797ACE|nr:uncharacterized protein LOC133917007 [Phragmites australis]